MLNRPSDAPWWRLGLSALTWLPGDGRGSPTTHTPEGELQPILIDMLGATVAAVWMSPDRQQRWERTAGWSCGLTAGRGGEEGERGIQRCGWIDGEAGLVRIGAQEHPIPGGASAPVPQRRGEPQMALACDLAVAGGSVR